MAPSRGFVPRAHRHTTGRAPRPPRNATRPPLAGGLVTVGGPEGGRSQEPPAPGGGGGRTPLGTSAVSAVGLSNVVATLSTPEETVSTVVLATASGSGTGMAGRVSAVCSTTVCTG